MTEKPAHYHAKASAAKHEGFLRYASWRWLKIATALVIIVIAGFNILQNQPGFRLRHLGGSWYGYATGIAGALLILWLTMLGVRKRAMTDGSWSLKAWVSAHVYLGLSLVIIVSFHTGLQFGWNVHTLAYALMMLVILSGIFGVVMYAILPARLSRNRGETTQKQMLEMIRSLDSRLGDAAQPLEQAQAALVRASLEHTSIGGNFWQRLTGRQPRCPNHLARLQLAAAQASTANAAQAAALGRVVGLLEQKDSVLQKARRHIKLRSWLEVWLYVHVPAAFALIAALIAHVVSVFFYW